MITRYALKNFFYYGLLFLGIFTAIFASCNVFIRLPFIHTASLIPMITIAMLPLMGFFALPLAANLSVCVMLINHMTHNELIIISFLKSAQRAFVRSVVIFSLISGLVYAMLVFQFAPQSYHIGKRLLLHAARDHVLTLEPNKFHTPFPSFTFFFKKKYNDPINGTVFSTLLLVFSPNIKKTEYYFFSAQDGFFKNNQFILQNGVLHFLDRGRLHSASFEQTEIDADKFVVNGQGVGEFSQTKFLTCGNLLKMVGRDPEAHIELHKRVAQVLWACVQPIVLFFICSSLPNITLLLSIFLCGLLYLLSYVLVIFAQAFNSCLPLAIFLFYAPIILILLSAMCFYKKNKI